MVPAVRGTACFLVMCMAFGVEGSFDLQVGDVVLAVDAVGVDSAQHRDAVPGPLAIWAGTRLYRRLCASAR